MNAPRDGRPPTPGNRELLAALPQGKGNFYQTKIPVTSRTNYITGIYALNIPASEETMGDWHENVFWHPVGVRKPERITLGGEGNYYDTNHIFEDMGVQEARERVIRSGLEVAPSIGEVYVANHTRAILDLAFYELNRYGRPRNVKGASSDWLDTPEQKNDLLLQAAKLGNYLVGRQVTMLDAWIKHEQSLD